MVFPGRFSTGCLRCRQRKVKCDEGKPSCKRCERYGKECPGYTDQFHFRHTGTSSFATPATGPPNPKPRKQSSASSRSSLETPSPQENESEVFSDEPVSQKDDSVASTPPSALGIQVLHPSHEQASLCYFIRRFVSPNGSDSFPGHLTFLPGLFDHHHQGVLETATLSVASMAAYNQFGGEMFRVQSYKEHGRALRMIQDMLQAGDQATDDKVIASVLLLCTLKDISGERPDHDNEHTPGLFYLLEKRGLEQLVTSRGTEMLLLALLRLQIYSFMRDDDIYSDPGGIVHMLAPYNPLFRALSIMSQSLSLRKRLFQCSTAISNIAGVELDDKMADTDSAFSQSKETLQACFEKLEEFDEWDREAASYWHCAFETRVAPTGLGQMSANMSFYDAETACIIILLRSARLTLLVSMLQYHDIIMLSDIGGLTTLLGDRTAWAECVALLTQDVVKTIDDILAAVPYAFGDFDQSGTPTVMPHDGAAAIVILHSIRLLTYCTYATPQQIYAARLILTRMNGHMGIRSAVDVAEAECNTWKLSWENAIPSPPTSNSPGKDPFGSSPQQTSVSIDGTDYGAWDFMNVV